VLRRRDAPPPPLSPRPRTDRTRLVPPPVRIGHAASHPPYESDTPRPHRRTMGRTPRARARGCLPHSEGEEVLGVDERHAPEAVARGQQLRAPAPARVRNPCNQRRFSWVHRNDHQPRASAAGAERRRPCQSDPPAAPALAAARRAARRTPRTSAPSAPPARPPGGQPPRGPGSAAGSAKSVLVVHAQGRGAHLYLGRGQVALAVARPPGAPQVAGAQRQHPAHGRQPPAQRGAGAGLVRSLPLSRTRWEGMAAWR